MQKKISTFGLELEKAISSTKTGKPHGVTQEFFSRLADKAQARGEKVSEHVSDIDPKITIGIVSKTLGEQGVDNGFNLLESALPVHTDLNSLAKTAALDLETTQQALHEESATIINMSTHPLGQTKKAFYDKHVAPKSLYSYLWFRGWDHAAGIDGKAQNSPATGVSAADAADAVSVIIGSGAAIIGIFANSPINEGKLTGEKESRLRIWDRMMGNSKVLGDLLTTKYPPQRFRTLAQYFNWMHGDQTGIHFVIAGGNEHGYKSLADKTLIVDGNPSVLDFLEKKVVQARYLKDIFANADKQSMTVTPAIDHMEAMQFAQFAGARVRYALRHDDFLLDAFLAGVKTPDEQIVEALFEKYAKYIYIEGRDAGSNFADQELHDLGGDIARSVIMAPAALQAGLIANLKEATRLLEKYGWEQLGALREAAIKDGLDGEIDGISVKSVAQDFLEVAARGLKKDEQWMIAYVEHVVQTGKNGADRAIGFVKKGGKIVDLIHAREVV